MNYELGKKLKDAGLVFETIDMSDGQRYVLYKRTFINIDGKSYLLPTLSELIEACGEGFNDLNRLWEGDWQCNVEHYSGDIGRPMATGTTPEEAVAHLWLALKEKKQ